MGEWGDSQCRETERSAVRDTSESPWSSILDFRSFDNRVALYEGDRRVGADELEGLVVKLAGVAFEVGNVDVVGDLLDDAAVCLGETLLDASLDLADVEGQPVGVLLLHDDDVRVGDEVGLILGHRVDP